MPIRKRDKILFWIAIGLILLLGTYQGTHPMSDRGTGQLVISEFMAANGSALADEDGEYLDWIEIFNPDSLPVNLSGWALTDDPYEPQKWTFPNVTLGGREYLVIFASGKDRKPVTLETPLHTNFRLSQAGEFIGLYNILEGRFIDQTPLQFPPQFRDISYGRYGAEQKYGYLALPTPGQPNDETQVWTSLIVPVEFSPTRGFYDAPLTVELITATPGAVIRYTVDGSQPTETNGLDCTKPIPVDHTTSIRAAAFKPGFLPSSTETHTYIFLDDVMKQPANPPGWPAAWGTYSEFYPGLPPKGAPVPADYAMDPRIVNDPRFHDTFKEDLKTIPVLSLVTEKNNFEIYANAIERGAAWERPVSVEFFDPTDKDREFQINAGIRMQGGTARWEYMPKKSFRLFFKGKYGATKLKFPVFPDSPVDEFDTLILRGGANRSYAGYIDTVDYTQVTYTRDEWMRASQIEMSGAGSHGIFVHLYLNGLYWGLYNLVERPDPSFAASYLGGKEEEWFGIKHGVTLLNPEAVKQGAEPEIKIGKIISGSGERYEAMLDLLEHGDLSDPDQYEHMQTYVDTTQFSDYIILNLYAGNQDWGDNNWYIDMRNPSGRLNYFVWDAEQVWFDGARMYLGKSTPHHKMRPLFLALMKNPDFKMEFADRLYKNLFHDGPLSDANAQARWLKINEPIEAAIVGESARWGDVRSPDDPIDRDDWRQARDNVLTQMDGNSAKLIALAREEGYYPPLDPPEFNQFGGQVTKGFELTMTASDGIIYYTTDGSDPRQHVTGEVAPTARPCNGPLTLTTTTQVKARALRGDPSSGSERVWSALNETTFRVFEGKPQLQITELMYNPRGGNEYEFIELKNTGDTDIDLSNMTFDGITFTFPPRTDLLCPGEMIVLVSNAEAFMARYPNTRIDGVYEGHLSNQGETIRLKDAAGNIITSVEYDDALGWPISPDGRGDSLVFVNLNGDPHDPKNWRASRQVNGSPGADEPE